MYGVWGGPPQSAGAAGDYRPVARPAGDLATAPRGKVKLQEVVQSALPALGLPGVTRPLRKGEQR